MNEQQADMVRDHLMTMIRPVAINAAQITDIPWTDRDLERFCQGMVSGVFYMLDPERQAAITAVVAMLTTDRARAL